MYKWIVFDCMETLIDMKPLPRGDDYAKWAFVGSKLERSGLTFERFNLVYQSVKMDHVKTKGEMIEFDLRDRLLEVARHVLITEFQVIFDQEQLLAVSEDLYQCFWSRYLNACYMQDATFEALETIQMKKTKVAVASNFTVRGGVIEILKKVGVLPWVDVIITSVDIGIRKPHPSFYRILLETLDVEPNEILFIGDDYACDYEGPKKEGIDVCLYDPMGIRLNINNRISHFSELKSL